ncbi:protein kinase/lanthionine synthetase C family protein [Streptomyces sp. A7024]|uniref:Protein kinase/lanthionine synthetase C family protein n=1 Tax=Streptomyces coryli TaxID=1128680 RepID=A0A6G4UD14_9ACTN|nr:class III lanthionine synthetase LanKC [Streptomyces coryli]NGN69227.1 protein kinase/lanthionine synthetase C family protein [Streptomyces coryli]
MDKRYEVFCLADECFYETPDRLSRRAAGGRFEAAGRPLPAGWRRAAVGDWLQFTPADGPELPAQGWKIHVSATLDNAEKIAAEVWDYCVPRGIAFKFVPGRRALHLRNSKYAARSNSGKFATIYPGGVPELRRILTELGGLLAGQTGPYVLTDLRWQDGPLYVRYGAFAKRQCTDDSGALVPAIEGPDGTLVPDRRDPAFQVPEWVRLPSFLEEQLAARNAVTFAEMPYRVRRALHFSNGGGVYAGTDERSGEQVVLKEARPHAGLAADGADAVARLERERTALERLAGLDVAPGVRDFFTLGDHRFLVMDFLEGRTLNSFFAERHPLLAADPDPAEVASYTRWALRMHGLVEEAVAAVHERGIAFNDLHMFNIMVAPDEESVRLLDFEAAADAREERRQAMAHPGFIAPAGLRGFDVDRYALACLRIALFVPMTSLLAVDRGKAAHLAETAAEQFPDVPGEFLAEAVRVIGGGRAASRRRRYLPVEPPAAAAGWPAARDAMTAAILAAATPERDDRLYPGDIAQFGDGGGLGIAHGAAGVLYALHATGVRHAEGEEWLLRQAVRPPEDTPPGLYDGLAGAAYVLDLLGHEEQARMVLGRVLNENWERIGPSLHGGLAGLGLVFGHFGLEDLARRAAELVAGRPQGADGGARAGRAGLLHGASGAALLYLRLHERTGDAGLLDLAESALRRDLARCVPDRSGALHVDAGDRTLPYVGAGSAGVAMVLDDFLAHRVVEDFAEARTAILPAACGRYYAQPGLFNGRAGMVLHLARTGAPAARLGAQARALGWYAMPYRGGLAFPGDQMMRLSMDLATGTAGCLLALGAAYGGPPAAGRAQLPFLPPLRRPSDRPRLRTGSSGKTRTATE